ncbi:MAG: DUF1569 domain-containing protein [Pirellulales bacterium]|nr:DUF1569 domain-containing protein [Pirellulales bacterium]
MKVDTRKVRNRRRVHYRDFDELLADAERLAALPRVQCLGNWTVGQTMQHLGNAMHGSIDGPTFNVPWHIKLIGRLFLWRWLVYGPFPAGLQLPRRAAERLIAGPDATTAAGLEKMRTGVARLRSETQRIIHPVTGPLTPAQWERFHLTHAALHMSFLVPDESA